MNLFQRYREHNDYNAREQILESHTNMVRAVAHQMCFDKTIYDDAVQEGIIGILTAIESFDYTRNIKFSTYCTPYIFKAIYNFVHKFKYKCKVPENYFHLMGKIKDIDITNCSIDEIKELLNSSSWNITKNIATHILFLSKNEVIDNYDKDNKFYRYVLNIAEVEEVVSTLPINKFDALTKQEKKMLFQLFGVGYSQIKPIDFQKRYNITKEDFIEQIKQKLV